MFSSIRMFWAPGSSLEPMNQKPESQGHPSSANEVDSSFAPGSDTPSMNVASHEAWLRRLASRLVRDVHAADDVAQETLIVGLESPPRSAPRHYLRAILRNKIRAYRRGADQRSDARYHLSHDTASDSSPGVVDAAELSEAVRAALSKIEEPLHGVMIERYLQGRTSVEIARERSVPEATVRSWLRRGRDDLRVHLDACAGGERSYWFTGLAPLLREAHTEQVPAKAVLLGSAVSWRLLAGIAAVMLGVLGVGRMLLGPAAESREQTFVVQSSPSGGDLSMARAAAFEPRGVAPSKQRSRTQSVISVPAAEESAAAEMGEVGSAEQVQHGGAERTVSVLLDVRVESKQWSGPLNLSVVTGTVRRPLPNALANEGFEIKYQEAELVTHRLEGRRGAYLQLLVTAEGHATSELLLIDSKSEGRIAIRLDLQPDASSVMGRVVDEGGRPIARAVVTAHDIRNGIRRNPNGSAMVSFSPSTTTDADGRFLLGNVRLEAKGVSVVAPGFARVIQAWEHSGPVRRRVDVVLAPGGSLLGRLVAPSGGPLAGAVLRIAPATGVGPSTEVVVGEGGSFEAHHLCAGAHVLTCDSGGGRLREEVTIAVNETVERVFEMGKTANCRVRLVDLEGAAFGAARVAFFVSDGRDLEPVYRITDADGRASLAVPKDASVSLSVLGSASKVPLANVALGQHHDAEHAVESRRAYGSTGHLSGSVFGLDPDLHGPARITVEYEDLRRTLSAPITPASGAFLVTDLPPGRISLRVVTARAGEFLWQSLDFGGSDLTLDALELPLPGTVRVDWQMGPGKTSYRWLQVTVNSRGALSASTVKTGTAQGEDILRLMPGDFLLDVAKEGESTSQRFTAHVRSGTDVKLRCSPDEPALTTISLSSVPSAVKHITAEFVQLNSLRENECEGASADALREFASNGVRVKEQASKRFPGGTFEFDVMKDRSHSWVVTFHAKGEPLHTYWLRQLPRDVVAHEILEWD